MERLKNARNEILVVGHSFRYRQQPSLRLDGFQIQTRSFSFIMFDFYVCHQLSTESKLSLTILTVYTVDTGVASNDDPEREEPH